MENRGIHGIREKNSALGCPYIPSVSRCPLAWFGFRLSQVGISDFGLPLVVIRAAYHWAGAAFWQAVTQVGGQSRMGRAWCSGKKERLAANFCARRATRIARLPAAKPGSSWSLQHPRSPTVYSALFLPRRRRQLSGNYKHCQT